MNDFNPNIPPPQEKSILEDYILNKIKDYTLVTLVQGETQTGKSTFVKYLMDNLNLYKYGEKWDYEKYCAKNLLEFVKILKKSENRFVVFEEATKDVSIDSWYDKYNHFFNVLLQTQGFRHNLIVIVFPSAMQLSNRNKYFIKLGITIENKIIEPETNTYATVYSPTIYKRDFKKLEEHDIYPFWWGRTHFVKYSPQDLIDCKKYIDWLIPMKEQTMDEIEKGIEELTRQDERKPKCFYCGSKVGLTRENGIIACKFHLENIPNYNPYLKVKIDKQTGAKYTSCRSEPLFPMEI
jgi:hypothetical protein